jgi:hypothetical protein
MRGERKQKLKNIFSGRLDILVVIVNHLKILPL